MRHEDTAQVTVSMHIFSCDDACWLPKKCYRVQNALSGNHRIGSWPCGNVSWSAQDAACAAAVHSDFGTVRSILIFWVDRLPQGQILFVDVDGGAGPPPFSWLPHACDMAIGVHKGRALTLAKLDTGTASRIGASRATWPASLEPSKSGVGSSMTLLPSGHVLMLHVMPMSDAADAALKWVVYDLQLSQRSNKTMPLPNGAFTSVYRHRSFTLVASQAAVAVAFRSLGTWVYGISGGNTIGRLLYAVPGLTSPAFGPGGHFLAGTCDPDVCVLYAMTGKTLVRLSLASTWARRAPDQCLQMVPCQLFWRSHSQLQVATLCRLQSKGTTAKGSALISELQL